MQILDLDHANSDDNDFDEGLGIMDKEMKLLEQLQKTYSVCQVCGPTKACKIDASAQHHKLNNNQLRGWARSLVRRFNS